MTQTQEVRCKKNITSSMHIDPSGFLLIIAIRGIIDMLASLLPATQIFLLLTVSPRSVSVSTQLSMKSLNQWPVQRTPRNHLPSKHSIAKSMLAPDTILSEFAPAKCQKYQSPGNCFLCCHNCLLMG